MPSPAGITGEDIRAETLTDENVSLTAAIQESKLGFNVTTGHHHDGHDSRLVASGGAPGTEVVDSSFTGAIDGVNDTYTLPSTFVPNSVKVFWRGMRQKRGVHFNEQTPDKIVFTSPPPARVGATLVFDYTAAA